MVVRWADILHLSILVSRYLVPWQQYWQQWRYGSAGWLPA